MDYALYVTTGEDGLDRSVDNETTWELPTFDGTTWTRAAVTQAGEQMLVLRRIEGLLDVLDEQIFIAETVEPPVVGFGQRFEVLRARLISGTHWGVDCAAHFALDCVEHGLGDSAGAELPHGGTLGEVLSDARAFLDDASEQAEHRLSVLSRLATARRLRKMASEIGELAFATLREDLANELDATDDPAWTTLAASSDATIACVEALRHRALPRYMAARDNAAEPRNDSGPAITPALFTTPWGPVMIGGEYRSPYVAPAIAAREAALRIREAVGVQHGPQALEAEGTWQADHLLELL